MVKDLGKNNISSGYAVFLPAISNFYVRKISQHYCEMTDMFPPERIPQGFENGLEGLNIFDKDKGEADSLAGLILEITGVIPKQEKEITVGKTILKVISVNKRRIEKINVRKK